MNIVFVTQSIGYGGASKMLTYVANQLSGRGHNVSIVNLNITALEIAQKVDEKITIYDMDGKKHGLKKLKCIDEIVKIAKKEKADLIIGFTLFPNVFACLAGKWLGIPSIISERGDPYTTTGKDIISRLFMWIINRSKGGVFQTAGAKDFYGKGLQRRGLVIPNPIFIKEEIPTVAYEEREKTVVSVGRLDNYQKRYDIMLQAFRLFHEKHPEYILKLYGDGSDVELIKSWTEDMGIADYVRFMGVTKQPMQDTARDGMFLITSDFEGISNALLEAMAVGLPCVSTDHTPGGARLLITDHENGLLAPVADSEKLAQAMCEFAENPELAERCGEKAKDVVNRFAPEKIIDQWEQYCLEMKRG